MAGRGQKLSQPRLHPAEENKPQSDRVEERKLPSFCHSCFDQRSPPPLYLSGVNAGKTGTQSKLSIFPSISTAGNNEKKRIKFPHSEIFNWKKEFSPFSRGKNTRDPLENHQAILAATEPSNVLTYKYDQNRWYDPPSPSNIQCCALRPT